MLAAAIRTASNIELELLIEAGDPLFELVTIHRAKPFVSVMASLQNSVPVQATVRAKMTSLRRAVQWFLVH